MYLSMVNETVSHTEVLPENGKLQFGLFRSSQITSCHSGLWRFSSVGSVLESVKGKFSQ